MDTTVYIFILLYCDIYTVLDTNVSATIGKKENAESCCTSIIIWRCSLF